jgi:hypothetical protein
MYEHFFILLHLPYHKLLPACIYLQFSQARGEPSSSSSSSSFQCLSLSLILYMPDPLLRLTCRRPLPPPSPPMIAAVPPLDDIIISIS